MLRPTVGEVVAAVGGVALLVGMSFDWFGVDVTASQIRGAEALADQSGGVTAWQAFEVTDLVLLVAAVVAIAFLAAEFTGGLPDLPVHPGLVVAVAGVVALAAAFGGLIDPPVQTGRFAGDIVVEVAREPGAWLSLVACAGIAAGGILALRRDPY